MHFRSTLFLFTTAIMTMYASMSMAQTTSVNDSKTSSAIRGPSLELALEAARTAIDNCASRDQRIGVTIIDAVGTTKVVLGSDGASVRGVTSSTNKALTALHFKSATSSLSEQAKTDHAFAEAVSANQNFNIRAGGLPITSGNDIIGAIGVGGARGSEIDEACALAALQKIQTRLQ